MVSRFRFFLSKKVWCTDTSLNFIENLISTFTAPSIQFDEIKLRYRRLKAKYIEKTESTSARIDSLEKENFTLNLRLEEALDLIRSQEQQIKAKETKLIELQDSTDENEKLRKIVIAAESKISTFFVEKDAIQYKLQAKDYDIRYLNEENADLKLAVSKDNGRLKSKVSCYSGYSEIAYLIESLTLV